MLQTPVPREQHLEPTHNLVWSVGVDETCPHRPGLGRAVSLAYQLVLSSNDNGNPVIRIVGQCETSLFVVYDSLLPATTVNP